jgi:uncharacterized protein (TIGR03083 family)
MASTMDVEEHIEQLRGDGSHLAAAVAQAGPETTIPACPEWVVRNLVHHLGRVHRWATAFVAGRYTNSGDVDFEGARLPGDAELVEWFLAGHGALVDALADAPADLECWSFLASPSPLAFWARRQSHETAIHRIDAEQAAGRVVASYTPAFAADGLDELLTGFVPRLVSGRDAGQPASIRFACTDDPAQWIVTIGSERPTNGSASGEGDVDNAVDCTVRGRAEDLYLALWRRRGTGALLIDGDPDVIASFLDLARI